MTELVIKKNEDSALEGLLHILKFIYTQIVGRKNYIHPDWSELRHRIE